MTSDDVQTVCVAVGPSLLGLAIAVIGSRLRVSQWRHRRIWCAALTFILLQAAMVTLVIIVYAGGEIRANSFTILAFGGLFLSLVALAAYGRKAFKKTSTGTETR